MLVISWVYILLLRSYCWRREKKKSDEILMLQLPLSKNLGVKDPI